MPVSDDTRRERKATVLGAMQKLRDDFPLQQVIEAAAPNLQLAYGRVLSYWTRYGAPPPKAFASDAVIQALCALDALVADECGIGCYPFSAHDTGIYVHFSGHAVSAMCAIDALAIPRLVRHASRITARCAMCGCHLVCAVVANGSVEGGNPNGLRVAWRPRLAGGGASCHTLCCGIGFLCRHCSEPSGAMTLSLPEAAAVGNSFFAFQRGLLDRLA